jgi:hypothetical protein
LLLAGWFHFHHSQGLGENCGEMEDFFFFFFFFRTDVSGCAGSFLMGLENASSFAISNGIPIKALLV